MTYWLRWSIPQLMSLCNLVCGVAAVVWIFWRPGDDVAWTVAMLVWLAATLDAFDGPLARKLGVTSRFGMAMDSVADFVSFGVAPGMLVCYLTDLPGPDGSHGGLWHMLVWTVGLGYILATAIRLLRYCHRQIKPVGNDEPARKIIGHRDFIGLPSPAAGLVLVTTAAGVASVSQLSLLGLTATLALLMVSTLRYRRPAATWRVLRPKPLRYVLMAGVIVGLYFHIVLTILGVLTLYLLIGWKSRRALEREEAAAQLQYPWPTP